MHCEHKSASRVPSAPPDTCKQDLLWQKFRIFCSIRVISIYGYSTVITSIFPEFSGFVLLCLFQELSACLASSLGRHFSTGQQDEWVWDLPQTQSPWRAEGKERLAPRTQFLLVFCPRPSTEPTGASLGSLLSDYCLPDLGGGDGGGVSSWLVAWLLT